MSCQPSRTRPECTSGELLATSVHEIAIRRTSERAGELVVHFPREDYVVVRTP